MSNQFLTYDAALCGPMTAAEHNDLLTFLNAQPLQLIEWMVSSWPTWETNGIKVYKDEAALVAAGNAKPSDFVLAADGPILNVAKTVDVCPLLSQPAAGLMLAVPQDAARKALFSGQLLAKILAYLKTLGFGSGKLISLLPQIIAIISQAAAGGTIDWQQVIALILQLFKPVPAPVPAPTP